MSGTPLVGGFAGEIFFPGCALCRRKNGKNVCRRHIVLCGPGISAVRSVRMRDGKFSVNFKRREAFAKRKPRSNL